ncbi:MAG: phenylalanine--tRNA ligase subunit beta [Candidatus Omnitrophota bacterium]
MKISYNWLKEYLDLKISPEALAHKLTMAGLEVKTVENINRDYVMEVEITSNRADWLSHWGVARETAGVLGKKIKLPKIIKPKLIKTRETLEIDILDKVACPLYTARLLKNIKVKDAPEDIKNKLKSVGINSVNNVVDIANFLLMETGQPLHAFDFDKLSGQKLIVRRAKLGEKITAIDGKTYNLDQGILVIADNKKPVAIAGVMGSKDTEVAKNTKNILLESAYFNPLLVRRACRKLALVSDSSYRFERSVDLGAIDLVSQRAINLIREFSGGDLVAERICKNYKTKKPTIISLDTQKVCEVLGKVISAKVQKRILETLGLEVKLQKNNLKAEIPSYRADLKIEEDLIEEIARIFGYEKINETLPFVKPQQKIFDTFELTKQIKNILVSQNLDQIISYSLLGTSELEKIGLLDNAVQIKNSLSGDFKILRPSFLPGILKAINYNLNRKEKNIRFFEIGKIFSQGKEELSLAVSILGNDYQGVLPEGKVVFPVTLLHLKGIVELVLTKLGINEYLFLEINHGKELIQGSELTLEINNQKIASLGKVSQRVLNRFDIKQNDIYFLQMSLEKLMPFIKLDKKYIKLNLYPVIMRDISLVIEQTINITELSSFLKKLAQGILINVEVADSYLGKHIPPGFKGITLSLTYQAKDHTLSLEELNPLHQALCQELIKTYNLTIR